MDPERQRRIGTLALQNVSGDDNHRDSALGDGGAHRDPQHPRHLLRLRNQFAVVAAILEQVLGMGFLEVAAADLLAGDLRGNREHRHAAAVAIVKAIDQVQIARPAAAGADRNLPGEMALCTGRKGGRLFMAHVHPFDLLVPANGVGDPVQRVAGDAIDAFYAGLGQRFDEHLRNFHSLLGFLPDPQISSARSQDVHRARSQQGQGGERDGGLHHHQHLRPAGEYRRIGGREGGAGIEGQKQIIHKAGRPGGIERFLRGSGASVIWGNRKSPLVWLPRRWRACGPPASRRQYQEAKTRMLVIQRRQPSAAEPKAAGCVWGESEPAGKATTAWPP